LLALSAIWLQRQALSVSLSLSLPNWIIADCLVSEDTILLSFFETWSLEFGSPPITPLPLLQSSWERPGVLWIRRWLSLISGHQLRVQISWLHQLAAHTGDWMFAFPIASCGLRLLANTLKAGFFSSGFRLKTHIYKPLPVCYRHGEERLKSTSRIPRKVGIHRKSTPHTPGTTPKWLLQLPLSEQLAKLMVYYD